MTAKTSSFTAQKNVFYLSVETLTVTDPTPVEGQGYIVFVRNGTATIDGVGYTSGNLIYRFYQGGAWSSTVFGVSAPINTATQTALDARERYLFNLMHDVNSVSFPLVTGVNVLTQASDGYLIPANTIQAGDVLVTKLTVIKPSNVTSANTATIQTRYNNSNSFSGSLSIGVSNMTTAVTHQPLVRHSKFISTSEMINNAVGFSNANDMATTSNASFSQTSFDTTVDNWIFIGINPSSTADDFRVLNLQISIIKNKS
jgi:hypothetical protein